MLLCTTLTAPSAADIIYVDNGGCGDCTTYRVAERDCGQGTERVFAGLQSALDTMNPGDTIYLRQGTHTGTDNTSQERFTIPTSKNGTAWAPGHFNTLASFPGEWAIIDGEGNSAGGAVLGNRHNLGSYQTCVDDTGNGSLLSYWKFERFGITGGTSPGSDHGGAGLFLVGGPFQVRYLHLFDNWDDTGLNNPSGLTLYRPRDSIFEYNYFQHNGAQDVNGDQVQIFTDYKDEWAGCDPVDLVDLEDAVRNNVWRYNFFQGSDGLTSAEVGLKYKGSQVLDNADGSSYANEDYGDHVHHNIFMGHTNSAVILRQDYLQFYNNILSGNSESLSQSQYGGFRRLKTVMYNNTVLQAPLVSYNESRPAAPFQNWDFFYNNISAFYAGAGGTTYTFRIFAESASSLDNVVNNLIIDRNYIYGSQSNQETPFAIASPMASLGEQYGYLSTTQFNSVYAVTNYQKASTEGVDDLFTGASGAASLITRGEHSVATGVTVSNGGIGGAHPYLEGVTMPDYLGATDPGSGSAWVAGVFDDVTSTSWLRSTAGRDSNDHPIWIGGSAVVDAGVVDVGVVDGGFLADAGGFADGAVVADSSVAIDGRAAFDGRSVFDGPSAPDGQPLSDGALERDAEALVDGGDTVPDAALFDAVTLADVGTQQDDAMAADDALQVSDAQVAATDVIAIDIGGAPVENADQIGTGGDCSSSLNPSKILWVLLVLLPLRRRGSH